MNKQELIDFEKVFVGARTKNNFTTLADWVERKIGDKSGDLLLQMDVEGAEYEVLATVSEDLLRRFRIMIIEFHHLEELFNRVGFEYITLCFSKLLDNFEVVHIHPNNAGILYRYGDIEIPSMLEITFLRKDRVRSKRYAEKFPHNLDYPNETSRPNYALPKCWHGQGPLIE